MLRAQVTLAKLMPHATSPEAIANEVDAYQQGWTDAVLHGTPELVDDLADEIESQMCNPATEDGQLVVLSRTIMRAPELANVRGLECMFNRNDEDFVTWSALDAWAVSAHRLQANEALSSLESRASDIRTLDRLKAIRSQSPLMRH